MRKSRLELVLQRVHGWMQPGCQSALCKYSNPDTLIQSTRVYTVDSSDIAVQQHVHH